MTAYEEMEKFLADLEATKWTLNDEKIRLVMQRQVRVNELDEALLTGDGAEISQAIDALDSEMEALAQRITVIDATLNGKRQSPALTAKVWAVINEAREGITDLRPQWDKTAADLAALDGKRLELVARLGEIDRAARRLSNMASQAAERLPSPKPGAPSLATGIILRHDRKSGCIFPDSKQIEQAFTGS